MAGTLAVLDVHKGDLKITFDKENPQEAADAKRMISDMLKRGYIILAKDPDSGEEKRVTGFDPEVDAYVVREERVGEKKGPLTRLLKRDQTEATVIPPTAGGSVVACNRLPEVG